MMREIWKDIADYEGLYQVSNFGKVRALNYKRTHQIKLKLPQNNGKGYLAVQLCKNNRRKWFLIHRLVAQAFLKNPLGKDTINHKDGDRANNKVSNLEWATYAENNLHSYRQNGKKPAKAKPVYCVETGEVYESSYDAARKTGLCQTSINRCANGIFKTVKGTHWKLLNNRKEILNV